MRQVTNSHLGSCGLERRRPCRCLKDEPPRELEPHQLTWISAASSNHRVCRIVLDQWTVDWRCHVCADDISGFNRARLDHDHATGKARGVLCPSCNSGLGYLDRPRWLDKALEYLQRTAYDQSVLIASAGSKLAWMPPPAAPRRCGALNIDGSQCGRQALRFLIETSVCGQHADPSLRDIAAERQRQWGIIAEGTFWSLQRLWREGDTGPIVRPLIVDLLP